MNILDAIKSGKSIRRNGFTAFKPMDKEQKDICYAIQDIIAEDWETLEDTKFVSITKKQLEDALNRSNKLVCYGNVSPGFFNDQVAFELGF